MVFLGTLQGSAQGTAQGNFQGTHQGTLQGNAQGTLQGNAQGTAQGNLQGTLQGNAQGTAQGNFQGTLQGNAQGNFQGWDVNTNNFYANWAMGAYGYSYVNAGTFQGTGQGNWQGYHQGYLAGNADSAGNAGYAQSAGYANYAGNAGNAGYANSSGQGTIRAWRSLDGGQQNIGYYEAQGNQGQGFCYFNVGFGPQTAAIAFFTGYSVQNTGIQQNGGVGIPSVSGTWQGYTFCYWTGTQRAGLRQGAFGVMVLSYS